MADDMDRAQARETLDRELALRAAEARIAASFAPVNPALADTCIDCEGRIEPARLQALRGATCRCSACAQEFEDALRRRQGVRRA